MQKRLQIHNLDFEQKKKSKLNLKEAEGKK